MCSRFFQVNSLGYWAKWVEVFGYANVAVVSSAVTESIGSRVMLL